VGKWQNATNLSDNPEQLFFRFPISFYGFQLLDELSSEFLRRLGHTLLRPNKKKHSLFI
jgi:hypothetical protein